MYRLGGMRIRRNLIGPLFVCLIGLLTCWTLSCSGESGGSSYTGPDIADLNARIARSPTATATEGVYEGGKGVLVRNPFDGLEDNQNLLSVPATLWVNDIFTPSQVVPSAGISPACPAAPESEAERWQCPDNSTSAFDYVSLAYVIGSQIDQFIPDYANLQSDDYDAGVFYSTAADSVSDRCRWSESAGRYECLSPAGYGQGTLECPPGAPPSFGCTEGTWLADLTAQGPGQFLPGNPTTGGQGGGAGCHANLTERFQKYFFDQTQLDAFGSNIFLEDAYCQCRTFGAIDQQRNVIDNGWDVWIDFFAGSAENTLPPQWPAGLFTKPSWALTQTACWHDNPRTMVNLQNSLYREARAWSSQQVPITSWSVTDPAAVRAYWGWNDVPVARNLITAQTNWDAVMIKLPAAACDNSSTATLSCVTDLNDPTYGLEAQLDLWYSAGYLVDGFPIVLAREWGEVTPDPSLGYLPNFKREFFCEAWEGDRYRIVSDPGAALSCYIERKT